MPSNVGCYDKLAPLLVAQGLRPVPIGPGTKKPQALHNGAFVDLPDWPTRPPITTPQPGAGTGLVLGERGLVAVDGDNEEILLALLEMLPATPLRKFGRRGETLFFRAPGLRSQKFKISGVPVCEILAAGTQTVLPPTVHPETGQPYRWTGPKTLLDISVNDLPLLPDDVVERIEEVLARFGYAPEPEHKVNGETSDSPFRALNELALKSLTAWVPALDIYNCKRRRGQHASYEAVATWRPSTDNRPAAQRDRNLKISGRGIQDFGDGRKYTPIDLVMAARECSFNEAVAFLDERLGWSSGGPEIHIGNAAGSPSSDETEDHGSADDDQNNGGTAQAGAWADQGNAGQQPPSVRAIPFVAFDEAALERRSWLYAKHYQRGQVTATIGPGGAGKSSLDLVEAIAMATGRNLLTEMPEERLRVWIHNGDDDAKEVNRRIAAVCRYYKIPMTELEGWLFATSKSDMTIKVASANGQLVTNTRTIREIIATISENNIDVAIFEPLVTLHAVPENDNVKMNAVIHLFGGIADGCNCAIDLCHHTRKLLAGVEEYNSDDGRGASAVRDGVRGSRVLNSISREEARKAGIEEQERLFYFRVDRGKANYLPPAASATWRKFENVELLNHDQVGVVTEWDFQETRIALSDDACEQVQAEVATGNYRENKQRSPERWLGRLVAKHLGLNPNDEKNDWKIRRGIRDLENRGVIIYELRKMADDHKEISYAAPGPWKRGSTT